MGLYDKNITSKEKIKYYTFFCLYVISLIILCFKILISILFRLMPNVFNKGKILDKKLYEGTDFNDDEED